MYSQDPDSQFFHFILFSVPSVSHQYDTDYNIKHPDETVNNHTKESVAMETQKHVISWKNINYTIGDKN